MNQPVRFLVGVLAIWLILAIVNNIGFATPIISGGVNFFDDPNAVSAPLMEQIGDDYGIYYIQDEATVLAFFAVQPGDTLSYPKYFAVEFGWQLIVAVILATVLTLTKELPYRKRIALIALMAVGAGFIIHSQYWNWWSFSTRYTLPAALIFITSWVAASAISARFIFHSN